MLHDIMESCAVYVDEQVSEFRRGSPMVRFIVRIPENADYWDVDKDSLVEVDKKYAGVYMSKYSYSADTYWRQALEDPWVLAEEKEVIAIKYVEIK